MWRQIPIQGQPGMKRIAIIAITLVVSAASVHAGFKMYGPNGQHMGSSETAEERTAREAREAVHRQIVEDYRSSLPPLVPPARKTGKNPLSVEDVERGKPPVIDDGPRPGGHRRHLWRERTGFNTPAERTRYVREIQRLNRELKKERAKPNPAGDHPSKIRKQFAP
jgi:hypothetical protein